MTQLDLDKQLKVLVFLTGSESTIEEFNQAYQKALDDLKVEVEAGQNPVILMEWTRRLKFLLFLQWIYLSSTLRIEEAKARGLVCVEGMN